MGKGRRMLVVFFGVLIGVVLLPAGLGSGLINHPGRLLDFPGHTGVHPWALPWIGRVRSGDGAGGNGIASGSQPPMSEQTPRSFRIPDPLAPDPRTSPPGTGPFSTGPGSGAGLPNMNVLLVGVDRRGKEIGRSDTIILAGVRPARREVLLYSIPRDTRVAIPGVGFTKINHAAAYGGIPLLKSSLETWLGVPIDHWVTVDFEGFRRLVNRIGGVPVDIEKAMDYDDPEDGTHIHLVPGRQWLDGQGALDYARFRGDPEADAARVRRQLQLVHALFLRSSNPGLWPALAAEAMTWRDHIKTDLGTRALVNLAVALYPFDQVTVRTRALTGVSYVDNRDGVWYLTPDRREVDLLRRSLARSEAREAGS
ncbi:conserved protein of unknown function [Kyrpidia spormannii]|uniref:Cell envelope-related transcriptional attenuator domain-containing protein n=1 Tax=Kyrpidia spormannii TaxID=2055160 RepID=A0A6F9EHR0_9BACL|nr:conserved protein of unknown function [Kyrpidia spormannii]